MEGAGIVYQIAFNGTDSEINELPVQTQSWWSEKEEAGIVYQMAFNATNSEINELLVQS